MTVNYDLDAEKDMLIDTLRRQVKDAQAYADIRARGAYQDGLAFGRSAISTVAGIAFLTGLVAGVIVGALAAA